MLCLSGEDGGGEMNDEIKNSDLPLYAAILGDDLNSPSAQRSLKNAGIIKEDNKESTEEKEKEAREVFKIMYEEIIDILKKYLVMKESHYKIIAIWILGTYCHEYFNTFPYLFFNAMRGSGKTRALKLLSALSNGGDGSIQNNLTEAVLFRIPRGITTCIDEIEQIRNKEKQTLRELLNSAYKKGMKVKRMFKKKTLLGEQQVVEEFEPYFPIVLANINGLDEVLADRSITLVLEKSDDPKITKKAEDFLENIKIRWIKLTLSHLVALGEIMGQKKYIEKWNFWLTFHYNATNATNTTNTTNTTNATNPHIKKYLEMTKQVDIEIDGDTHDFFVKLNDTGITGRNFELFMPLLILAKFIDDMIFDEIFEVVGELVKERKQEEYHESIDVSLYQFVITKEDHTEFLKMKDLVREFREYIGEGDNQEDKWLNERWFSRALKRLNLVLDKRKLHGCSEVRIN